MKTRWEVGVTIDEDGNKKYAPKQIMESVKDDWLRVNEIKERGYFYPTPIAGTTEIDLQNWAMTVESTDFEVFWNPLVKHMVYIWDIRHKQMIRLYLSKNIYGDLTVRDEYTQRLIDLGKIDFNQTRNYNRAGTIVGTRYIARSASGEIVESINCDIVDFSETARHVKKRCDLLNKSWKDYESKGLEMPDYIKKQLEELENKKEYFYITFRERKRKKKLGDISVVEELPIYCDEHGSPHTWPHEIVKKALRISASATRGKAKAKIRREIFGED